MSLQPTLSTRVATGHMLLLLAVMYNELSLSNEYMFFKLSAHGVTLSRLALSSLRKLTWACLAREE